jgi:hypothetical protein
VRRSELQMLARAVGVRSVLPMMVLHHFVCIGLTRDLPHLRRGMPRGCSQPGARLRGQLPTSRRVLDFAPPRHSTMTNARGELGALGALRCHAASEPLATRRWA